MSTEENNIKVYELAKELGKESFALLDTLKELSIEVKSHMSALSTEDAQKVRDFFLKPKETTSKTAKSTKTVKRAPKVAKTETTTEVKAKTKTTTTKRASSTATKESSRKSSSTVIRRRSAESGQLETIKGVDVTQKAQESHSENYETTDDKGFSTQQDSFSEESAKSYDQNDSVTGADSATTSKAPTSNFTQHSLLSAKQGGMTAQKPSSVLTIVKEEPRKAPTAKPGTAQSKTSPQQPATPGIINYGKDAIDRMAEEEVGFRKKAAKTDRERELEELKEVKVSDYRAKKELIFLPKKKRIPLNREVKKTEITKPAAHKLIVKMENSITVNDLAQSLGQKTGILIKKLIGMGMMVTTNQALDFDTATIIAAEFGHTVENVSFKEESVLPVVEDQESTLKHRAPIVTVMGHVDHGKTSLLDAIRSAKVAAGEAGGITQHIGAYTVEIDGKHITFIDTPGHEAFTMMRSRGANVTDIVILVVAADDGVMPQTREALDHARAAGVPIIVAINKIDKPSANPDRILKELAELDLLAEEWGGQTMFVRVSAIQKKGIKELLEAILLQAEVLDLKANPDRKAEGVVLEARMDKNRGVVATVLVKKGTLNVSDTIVSGIFCGRVRAMSSSTSQQIKSLAPSEAAEILGLEGVPTAGDTFNAVATEADARKLAQFRLDKQKAEAAAAGAPKVTLEDLFSKVQQGEVKELPIILKTDVFGSCEAIRDSLNKIESDKVKIKVILSSPGGITESDVMLASASKAIIIGFNVRPETKALQVAESKGIEIKSYTIIYELLDDVKNAMAGLLDKKAVEKYLGRAEVRETFSVPKIGVIAGCAVVDGKIIRGCQVRLLRDSRVIYTGKLSSLKRFKDDAKEVATGYECGMGIENFNDLKQGDIIEAFEIEMIAQTLESTTSNSSQKSGAKSSSGNEART